MKTLYVVRHCKAEGQEADAPLTLEGVAQANRLADSLAAANIERIISSPYVRATQSIAPLARRLGLAIELDVRLVLKQAKIVDPTTKRSE
jgi:2,3-bisphosphoglycerate-dependent phosphoglycerate mutase